MAIFGNFDVRNSGNLNPFAVAPGTFGQGRLLQGLRSGGVGRLRSFNQVRSGSPFNIFGQPLLGDVTTGSAPLPQPPQPVQPQPQFAEIFGGTGGPVTNPENLDIVVNALRRGDDVFGIGGAGRIRPEDITRIQQILDREPPGRSFLNRFSTSGQPIFGAPSVAGPPQAGQPTLRNALLKRKLNRFRTPTAREKRFSSR